MNCESFKKLIDKYTSDELNYLDDDTRKEFREHYSTCHECWKRLELRLSMLAAFEDATYEELFPDTKTPKDKNEQMTFAKLSIDLLCEGRSVNEIQDILIDSLIKTIDLNPSEIESVLKEKIADYKKELFVKSEIAVKLLEKGKSPEEVPEIFIQALLKVLRDSAAKNFQKNDIKEALSLLHQAILYRPKDEKALNMLGNVYNAIGSYDEALNYYKMAYDVNNSVMVLSYIGYVEARLGNADRAKEIFQKTEIQESEDFVVLNNLAVFRIMEREYNDAIELLYKVELLIGKEQGITINSAGVYNNLALALSETGKTPEALRYIKMALDLDPENDVIQQNHSIITGESEGDMLFII